jgi:hypothetical protein
MVDLYHPVTIRSGRVAVFNSFRAYRTLDTHPKGRGWCLYITNTENHMEVKWYWFKDLMTMFSFMITYPEGE